MSAVKDISIEAYDYPLPDDRIAKYPLAERDASKLLVLRDNEIQESQFKHIGDFLPQDSLLVFNEPAYSSTKPQARASRCSALSQNRTISWLSRPALPCVGSA